MKKLSMLAANLEDKDQDLIGEELKTLNMKRVSVNTSRKTEEGDNVDKAAEDP